MTETSEAESSTATARPVRVPNVSSGAISGLAHEVIGAAAQDAHDATHGDYDDGTGGDPSPTFDPENPDHVDALVSIVPEDRQLAVRQALTGTVVDGEVVTDLDPAPDPLDALVASHVEATDEDPDAVRARLLDALNSPTKPLQRVDGTQTGADPASSLTGTGAPVSATPEPGDPTNGALPTGDVEPRPEVSLPDDLADTVDARVAWANAGQSRDEVYDRAALLLRLEAERDTQRTTLVEPLRAITDDYETVPDPAGS